MFFNFHGTAGLWRRSAIETAGGWSADTLTEDLDLSFRAQLQGWQFVYLPEVGVPAELPETLSAFRQQQARWAQGTIATARKLLRSIMRARIPLRAKVESAIQLTCHAIYPATLLEVARLAFKRSQLALGLIGIVESKSALAQRIQRLLDYPVPRSAKLGWTNFAALILVFIIALTGRDFGPMRAAERRAHTAPRTDGDAIVGSAWSVVMTQGVTAAGFGSRDVRILLPARARASTCWICAPPREEKRPSQHSS